MDITAIITQLTAERDKIDKAIETLRTLEDSSGSAPRSNACGATTRRRATRRTVTTNAANAGAKAVTPEQVVKLVTGDGVPASAIRGQTGGSPDAVLRVLKQLESDGAVRRTGERRSTKWHSAEN